MGVIELMLGFCLIAILAAVAIHFYINYMQQARVVAIVIPGPQGVESNISYFCATKNRMQGGPDAADIITDSHMEYLEIVVVSGSVTMSITAKDKNPDWTFWMVITW